MKTTAARGYSVDRLGALLSVGGLAATLFLPFVVFKANRIVPGDARSLLQILPIWAPLAFYGVLILVAVTAVGIGAAWVRLAVAMVGIAALTLTIGAAGDALTPLGNKIVRVSP